MYLQEEKLYKAFSALDINNTGKIKKEEILNILRNNNSGNQYINELINKAYDQKEDTIDYKQFLSIMGYNKK